MGGCFQSSFPRTLHAPRHFNLFLGFRVKSDYGFEPSTRRLFPTFSTTIFCYFDSTTSVPKIDFSQCTLHTMARGIHGTLFPTGLRTRLPSLTLPLSSSVFFQASSHERTIIAIPPCLFPRTLDGSLFPVKRRWRYGRNSERSVGVNRTTSPRRLKLVATAKRLWDDIIDKIYYPQLGRGRNLGPNQRVVGLVLRKLKDKDLFVRIGLICTTQANGDRLCSTDIKPQTVILV